ncbi:hypothetical protein O0I10_010848 [Lichtheimia ornata]|uniref:Zn(2)-C6 fungal-type domain-containing protein n=1 Tax=Lichtheimia ornata TaxID=688661 RepID=A0AAD7UVY3_9FUNG|nr:uncharacterized protein O0I10_010848 [Lichtheimia ornata]KAJ8653520.1 hypothetical protein O0I10_010848 [Lichtheimia ornata]
MLSQQQQHPPNRNKPHVQRACINCRRAHLACDTERPCRRCVSLGKQDGCYDIDHKKRGRPKLKPNNSSRATTSYTTASEFMRHSSFTMTTLPPTAAQTTLQGTSSPVVTAFLSMEICCARVSDEVQTLLGYYPQELAHRPLYSFIAPTSSEVLARLHRVLLDNVTHVASSVDATWQRTPPTERTTSEKFFSTHPDTLTAIANGSQTVADILWMKRNDGGLEALQAQFYLGGGLGADLYQPTTLGSLYIICLLSRPTRATAAAASVYVSNASTTTTTTTTTHITTASSTDTPPSPVLLTNPTTFAQQTLLSSSSNQSNNSTSFMRVDALLS